MRGFHLVTRDEFDGDVTGVLAEDQLLELNKLLVLFRTIVLRHFRFIIYHKAKFYSGFAKCRNRFTARW